MRKLHQHRNFLFIFVALLVILLIMAACKPSANQQRYDDDCYDTGWVQQEDSMVHLARAGARSGGFSGRSSVSRSWNRPSVQRRSTPLFGGSTRRSSPSYIYRDYDDDCDD